MISIVTRKRWHESHFVIAWWCLVFNYLSNVATFYRRVLWSFDFLQEFIVVLLLLVQVDVERAALVSLVVAQSRSLVDNGCFDSGVNSGVLLTIINSHKRCQSVVECWFVPLIFNLVDQVIHLRKNLTTDPVSHLCFTVTGLVVDVLTRINMAS